MFGLRTHTFEDGTSYMNVAAAIQAAYLAGDYQVAREIASRYDLDHFACLRCVNAFVCGDPVSMAERLAHINAYHPHVRFSSLSRNYANADRAAEAFPWRELCRNCRREEAQRMQGLPDET